MRYTPLRATWSRSTPLHRTGIPCRSSRPPDTSPVIPPRVRRHRSFSARPDPVSARRASSLGFVAQPSNPTVLWWTAANPTCRLRSWTTSLHQLLSTTSSCFSCHHAARTWPRWPPGSLEPSLLVSPLLGGPARHRPFPPTLQLHLRKSNHNLQLQYSAKSQSTPHCQSLIIARSDHPPDLGLSSPQSPPWWVHWQHTHTNQLREKEKKNRNKWKTQTSDQKRNKSQNDITWERKILVP
jgi:hypothetical protein